MWALKKYSPFAWGPILVDFYSYPPLRERFQIHDSQRPEIKKNDFFSALILYKEWQQEREKYFCVRYFLMNTFKVYDA